MGTFTNLNLTNTKNVWNNMESIPVQVWNPYLKKYIVCLEKIKKRATKLVHSLTKMSYEQRLEALGLYSLQQRSLRGDLFETYKILTGKQKN